MNSKFLFWLLTTVLLTTVPSAQAQQTGKIFRIGGRRRPTHNRASRHRIENAPLIEYQTFPRPCLRQYSSNGKTQFSPRLN